MLRTLLVLLPIGCAPGSSDSLVIATNWTESRCDELEQRLAAAPRDRPVRLRWIRVGPDEDPTRILDRRAPVDLVVGGPASSYERLSRAGRLDGEIRGDAPAGDSPLSALIAAEARPAEWANLFARLVRGDGSGEAKALAGEAQACAVVKGTANPEAARALRDLAAGWRLPDSSRSVLFLPDLLRAALITADVELRAARASLADAGNPARSLALFTEAPPWPPASIEKMRSRGDRESLMKLLAEQVAPDPVARQWLLQSWSRASQPIDGVMLDTLARAADGRLAAEPRFRAWLRSEWTAWSRQRYRRVVSRLADSRYAPP